MFVNPFSHKVFINTGSLSASEKRHHIGYCSKDSIISECPFELCQRSRNIEPVECLGTRDQINASSWHCQVFRVLNTILNIVTLVRFRCFSDLRVTRINTDDSSKEWWEKRSDLTSATTDIYRQSGWSAARDDLVLLVQEVVWALLTA